MRRICVILVDRANYGRLLPVMRAIRAHDDLELQVICGGSMVLDRFTRPVDMVREDEFPIDAEVYHACEGSVPISTAKSIGHGISEYASELERLDPEFVLIIGDRHEALAAAIAATYTRRCILHFQGGEQSGSLDESARHAITKLAHYHAPATILASQNLIRMGEDFETIISVGCPSSDLAVPIAKMPTNELVVSFHPHTAIGETVVPLLDAVSELLPQYDIAWYWPNIDAGSNAIHKELRRRRDATETLWGGVQFVTNEHPKAYLERIAGAACCVGNSSSFVRDAGLFGTPTVLVGDRQLHRERADNVLPVRCDKWEIKAAIQTMIGGKFMPSDLYGDGHVSERIVQALAKIEPYIQKRLSYTEDTPCQQATN